MSMTDPIADFLTRIRNGIQAAHDEVDIPASRPQERGGPHPAGAGLHRGLRGPAPRPSAPGERISVRLKYTEDRRSVITGLRRVSRPGRRTYVDSVDIPKVQGGMGTTII